MSGDVSRVAESGPDLFNRERVLLSDGFDSLPNGDGSYDGGDIDPSTGG